MNPSHKKERPKLMGKPKQNNGQSFTTQDIAPYTIKATVAKHAIIIVTTLYNIVFVFIFIIFWFVDFH